MNRAYGLLALLVCACAACSSETGGELAITEAWIRTAPPTASMHAGYLVITNPGDEPLRITGVSSPVFDRVEMHRTEITDGIARMHAEPFVEVPAGDSVVFEPGGRHLMLFGAQRPLDAGDTVALRFVVTDRDAIEATAVVRDGPGSSDHSHH